MNKKVLLTIFLATILALFAAIFVFHKFQKSNPKKPTIQKEEIQVKTETDLPEVKQEEVKTNVQQPKKVQKVYKKQAVETKTEVKQIPKQKIEPIKKEPVENINTNNETDVSVKNSEEESNDVIIPVKYTTKNTYKYIYTPNRF